LTDWLTFGLVLVSLGFHVVISILLGYIAWVQNRLISALKKEVQEVKDKMKDPQTYKAIIELIGPLLEEQKVDLAKGIVATMGAIGDELWHRIEDRINGKYGQMIKQGTSIGLPIGRLGLSDVIMFFFSKNKKEYAKQLAIKLASQSDEQRKNVGEQK